MLRYLSLFFILIYTPLFSQEADQYFDWTPRQDYHKSIVRVTSDQGSGSGVVITKKLSSNGKHYGLVLTADHVVADCPKVLEQDGSAHHGITVIFYDKTKGIKCILKESMKKELSLDICQDLCLVYTWIPKSVSPIKIAKAAPSSGSLVEIVGWGNDEFRHFSGLVTKISSPKAICVDSWLIAGDSGGTFLNSNGELVGIVSGGYVWDNQRVYKRNEKEVKMTWPARGSGLELIRKFTKGK